MIEPVPRSMAAKFEVEVGEPGKTLYVIGHGGFPEFLWGFSIIMMMMMRSPSLQAPESLSVSSNPHRLVAANPPRMPFPSPMHTCILLICLYICIYHIYIQT